MGCSSSKTVRVSPADIASGKSNVAAGSKTSLQSGERPFGSATSKTSKHSNDSGYSAQELAEDEEGHDAYANVITENSDARLVQEIESGFQEQELGELALLTFIGAIVVLLLVELE